MKSPLHLEEINRARDYYNPLVGLDIARVVRIINDAERGKYDELQKLNRVTEKRHPTLKGLKARRLSALKKLSWDCKVPDTLPPGITAAQAETQRVYLRGAYEQIGNLPQVFEFLALPSFRGFAHLEKRYQDDDPSLPCNMLNPVPQWHWLRDPQTWKWKYDPTARYDLSRAVEIDPANFVIREIDDPLCEIALLCFIRRNLAKKDHTAFMEDYAIPSIFAMLGENTPLDKVKEWLAIMQQVTSNSRGALPPGSTVETLEAKSVDGVQFTNFIAAEDQDLVLAGTGGLLTMLTANTGLGGDKQGDNHQAAFDAIAQAEAMEITAILQKQFDHPLLKREFPSQPVVAYFELAALDEEDVNALAERVGQFYTAGLEADADEISEKAGIKLTRAAPRPVVDPAAAAAEAATAAEALKNRAVQEAGKEARYLANSQADLSEADQATLKPAVDRVVALLAIQDDAEFEKAYRQFQADLPALEEQCLGDDATAPLEAAFDEIIGTAMVSGAVEAAEARNQAAEPGRFNGPGAKTAPSTRKSGPGGG